jgi:hypothetical protein
VAAWGEVKDTARTRAASDVDGCDALPQADSDKLTCDCGLQVGLTNF